MNVSIGQNWLNKKNPFEYIVPPSRGSEQQLDKLDLALKAVKEWAIGLRTSSYSRENLKFFVQLIN